MKKIVREGERIPMFYGIAYIEPERMVATCYPIPCNILIGFFRKIYFYLVSGWDFKNGYDKGWLKGRQEGEEYAFRIIKEQVIKNNLEEILRRFTDYQDKMFKARLEKKDITGWIWEFIEEETKRLKNEI